MLEAELLVVIPLQGVDAGAGALELHGLRLVSLANVNVSLTTDNLLGTTFNVLAVIISGQEGKKNDWQYDNSFHLAGSCSDTDDASVLAADPNKDLHQIRCLEMMSLYYVLSTICFKHENV